MGTGTFASIAHIFSCACS